jgi:ferredoxin-thioredoxin reductase catalytic subunit
MNIKKNSDNAKYEEITQAVKDNGGYCPCELEKNEDTKCMCKAFKESKDKGECHCGRFVKE